MDTTTELMHFPVAVRAVGDAERIATLNDILRRDRVLDSEILEEHPPYFFRGEISSTRLDSYYTHMLLSSLQNYAREAAEGVGFLPSHDHGHLPIGGSLTGELSAEGDVSLVRADFYTLANMAIQSINTDDLIGGIRGGLTRYLSIGWYGGNMVCDLCGQSYYGRCPHIAGLIYEDEKDGVVRQVRATVGIDDAHLAEVSGVYKGATPGAMIEKVYEMARGGAISADDVRQAQVVYRLDKATTERMLALPALQKRHAGVEVKPVKQDEKDMELAPVRAILTEAGIEDSGDLAADVRALAQQLDAAKARTTDMEKRIAELEPRAADGEQYRNDLVAEALAEGVRAYGESFDQETYEEQLRAAPLKVIKRMRDDWQAVGDSRFAGGRQTTEDDDQDDAASVVEVRAPASYYA